jgi:ABC-type sulfate transport system permease component
MHERGWVAVRVAGLDFQSTMIAIFTDTTPLALPPGVAGLAGLTFLRQFASWGGQLTPNGWQFLLSDGRD